ncbi:MAG: calcium/sodium antiporter [Deferrisomatales bacterium]|nr:calcium/sodium antiporter [Deferrisomatales bacterium]
MELHSFLLLIAGFAALLGGAEALVRGAVSIARRLRVSELVIGLTVVAFGTSAPELAVNVFGAWRGEAEIAVGNVVGSNLFNLLCILGLSALIRPLAVAVSSVRKEIPLSLLAALVVAVLANDAVLDGGPLALLSRSDGLVLLAFFAVFLYYLYEAARSGRAEAASASAATTGPGTPAALGLTLAGLVLLVLGGQWVVSGAVGIARALGWSPSLIALTVVAVGTSLPELATSVVASWRGNTDIAVGNVVGSNIFNLFFVLGTSAVVGPLPVAAGANVDFAVLIAASVLLLLAMFTGGRRVLDRWEGGLFLAGYAAYVTYLVAYR